VSTELADFTYNAVQISYMNSTHTVKLRKFSDC